LLFDLPSLLSLRKLQKIRTDLFASARKPDAKKKRPSAQSLRGWTPLSYAPTLAPDFFANAITHSQRLQAKQSSCQHSQARIDAVYGTFGGGFTFALDEFSVQSWCDVHQFGDITAKKDLEVGDINAPITLA